MVDIEGSHRRVVVQSGRMGKLGNVRYRRLARYGNGNGMA